MGILTYFKLGAAVIIVALAGYFYWDYRSTKAENAALKVAVEQQQEAIEFYQKAAEIDVDTAKEKEKLNEAIKSGDPQRIVDYFKRMKELSQGD